MTAMAGNNNKRHFFGNISYLGHALQINRQTIVNVVPKPVEPFSREKLLSGVKKACQKRPISPEAIEELVERIVSEIADHYDREVPGMAVGERVMEGLRALDKVAYIRFASVYRRFEEVTEFVQEVQNLEANHDTAKP